MTELEKKITQTLEQTRQRDALLNAVKRGRDSRANAVSEIPGGASFREEVQGIKQRCIQNLPVLLKQFTERAEGRSAKVYFAKTDQDACNYVLELAKQKNAKLITKSKSLTTEEIELNHPLEEAGLTVIETDLGERIIQMAKELPYHLVFPAVHKTTAQVAKLFSEATGEKVKSDLKDIMALMRRSLRPIFLDADIGITGANVAIAETGSVLIETNEGNGRLVSSIPPVHVCVMGLEKIVETIEDALKMIFAHPVSAVGQLLTTYVSFFAGRSSLAGQENREFHIVILDNGRQQMRSDAWFQEALHCIRCGACMNICPTYGVLGGHVFGHIYPGPIGIPWTAQVHGLKHAAEFSDLCISCGLCKEICPADIDIPMMISKVKFQSLENKPQLLVNKILMASETFAKLASLIAPVSNWVLQSAVGRLLNEKIFGLESQRTWPKFKRGTFKKQYKKHDVKATSDAVKVAFFTDYFANYISPELGLRATELLSRAEIEIDVPRQKSSGYPYISYGELKKAAKVAAFNVERFFPLVEKGSAVVTTEPTAAYAFKYIYPKLLKNSEESILIAENTYEFFEYLTKLMDEGRLLLPPQIKENRTFGYHISCHQRAGSSGNPTLKILQTIGYDIRVIETGTCCGMAGTFGLKQGPLGYDLSMAVGQPLFELFKESDIDAIVTESSICKIQLEDGAGLRVFHPLELIESN